MVEGLIVTGASGWFGNRLIAKGFEIYGPQFLRKNFFVSSDGREIRVKGKEILNVRTLNPKEATKITNAVGIVQSAFLTRNYLKEMGKSAFHSATTGITRWHNELRSTSNADFTFLISSGAARHSGDLYSRQKVSEEESVDSDSTGKCTIFRVYAATSEFMPIRPWSALSQFIGMASAGNNIHLNAKGRVYRSFVSFDTLSEVILRSTSSARFEALPSVIDACSAHIELGELAEIIAGHYGVTVIRNEKYSSKLVQDDYRGSLSEFVQICSSLRAEPTTIEDQIRKALSHRTTI